MNTSAGLSCAPPGQPPPPGQVSFALSLILLSRALSFIANQKKVVVQDEDEQIRALAQNLSLAQVPRERAKDCEAVSKVDCHFSAVITSAGWNRQWETWVKFAGVATLRSFIKATSQGLVTGPDLETRTEAALRPLALILTYSTFIPLRAMALSALEGVAEACVAVPGAKLSRVCGPPLTLLDTVARHDSRPEFRLEAARCAVSVIDACIARSPDLPEVVVTERAVSLVETMLSDADEGFIGAGLAASARWLPSCPSLEKLHALVTTHIPRLARARSTPVADAALRLIPLLRADAPGGLEALHIEAALAFLIGDYGPAALATLGGYLAGAGDLFEMLCPAGSSAWFSDPVVRVSRSFAAKRVLEHCKPAACEATVLSTLQRLGSNDPNERNRALLAASVAIELEMPVIPAALGLVTPESAAQDPERIEAILEWAHRHPPPEGGYPVLSGDTLVLLLGVGLAGIDDRAQEDRFRDLFVASLHLAVRLEVTMASMDQVIPSTLNLWQMRLLLHCGGELMHLASGDRLSKNLLRNLIGRLLELHEPKVGSDRACIDHQAVDISLEAVVAGLELILAAGLAWPADLVVKARNLAKAHQIPSFPAHLCATLAKYPHAHGPDTDVRALVQGILGEDVPSLAEATTDQPPAQVPCDLLDLRVLADLLWRHFEDLPLCLVSPHLAPLVTTCSMSGFPIRVEEIAFTWLALARRFPHSEVIEAEKIALHRARDGLQLTHLVRLVLLPAQKALNSGIDSALRDFAEKRARAHGVQENTSIKEYLGLKRQSGRRK